MDDTTRKNKKEKRADSRQEKEGRRLPRFMTGKAKQESALVPTDKNESELATLTEDSGAKIETKRSSTRAAAPVSFIFSCILIALVFMYMLTLNVSVEEYNKNIKELKGDITRLKEEKTQLEVQWESRFDLDEVERIATEEYGMVSADSLPKKYVSLSDGTDVLLVQPGEEENDFHTFVTGFVSALRDLLS